jgi:hypothetical protein
VRGLAEPGQGHFANLLRIQAVKDLDQSLM